MDARKEIRLRFVRMLFAIALILSAFQSQLNAAEYETVNFKILDAPTRELAREFGETAERSRRELAVLWIGKAMPDWSAKCPIKVRVGKKLGAGGSTSFIFQGGEVFGWEMDIQGSAERIVDSVLPHEITHMILASHFRRPIPRWLDEGIATSVECDIEKDNYRNMLRHFISKDVQTCLPCRRLVALKEYPTDVMPFYAQSFSIVEYLLLLRGHRELIRFAETGMSRGNWDEAFRKHYGFEDLGDFQANYWVRWVGAGSPSILVAALRPVGNDLMVASVTTPTSDMPSVQPMVLASSVEVKTAAAYAMSSDSTTRTHVVEPNAESDMEIYRGSAPTTTLGRLSNNLRNLLPGSASSVPTKQIALVSHDTQLPELRTPPPAPKLLNAEPLPAYGNTVDNNARNTIPSASPYKGVYSGVYRPKNDDQTVVPIPSTLQNDQSRVAPISASFAAERLYR